MFIFILCFVVLIMTMRPNIFYRLFVEIYDLQLISFKKFTMRYEIAVV